MSTDLVTTTSNLEALLINGDLSKLSPADRLTYYRKRCESLGIDPLSASLQYIVLQGKLTLYATKSATEQIAAKQGLSLAITGRDKIDGVYVVTCRASTAQGRFTESTGAIWIEGLKAEALCNAMMKAETKAKRRAVLSLCGTGLLDETEVQSIPDVQYVAVDYGTGEILQEPAPIKQTPALSSPVVVPSPAKKKLARAMKEASLPMNAETFNTVFGTEIPEGGVKEFMAARSDVEVEAMCEALEDYISREPLEEGVLSLEPQANTEQGSQTLEAMVA